jgi:hypothetical protein
MRRQTSGTVGEATPYLLYSLVFLLIKLFFLKEKFGYIKQSTLKLKSLLLTKIGIFFQCQILPDEPTGKLSEPDVRRWRCRLQTF